MSDLTIAQRLQQEVIEPMKARYVGRDEVIDLIGLALVAGEHLFLYGPPGTAKSALVREFSSLVQGRYFEYMLTRFSEPNEIFGPIDIGKLREGVVATVTSSMLPEAEFAFLDELFNANSAILNNLLTVLNERVYRRGAETHHLPLLSLFSASNHLPEDDALQALFDRFLIRCQVNNLPREQLPHLLTSGWLLEGSRLLQSTITAGDIRQLSSQIRQVSFTAMLPSYAEVVVKVRDLGIALSDRRSVKILKLMAASAVLCGRTEVVPGDMWVLRYVWDREEQIQPLATLVQGVLEQQSKDVLLHSLATPHPTVDAESLALQLAEIKKEIESSPKTLTSLARLRERVSILSDKAAWVADETARQHLLSLAREYLQQLK
ncbi:MAG TPA: AAA family ATPase [Gemmatales bacterium]|nr:AAA family ATPase [Gemmatales bacterium]